MFKHIILFFILFSKAIAGDVFSIVKNEATGEHEKIEELSTYLDNKNRHQIISELCNTDELGNMPFFYIIHQPRVFVQMLQRLPAEKKKQVLTHCNNYGQTIFHNERYVSKQLCNQETIMFSQIENALDEEEKKQIFIQKSSYDGKLCTV